jgi:hypothetical protein
MPTACGTWLPTRPMQDAVLLPNLLNRYGAYGPLVPAEAGFSYQQS